jgi:copper transport protein
MMANRRQKGGRAFPLAIGALAAAAQLSAACVRPAWGHANARGTDPPQGARLTVLPPSIRLWFDEAVVPEVSTLRLLDRAGKAVQEGPLKFTDSERKAAEFALGRIEPGAYTVAWKVLSAVDGHVTRGAFAFANVPPGFEGAVGMLAAPEATSPGQRAWIWALRSFRVAAVWAHLLALLAITGLVVVWLGVVRPAAASGAPLGALPPGLIPLISRGALVSLAGGVLSLQLEWLQVSEAPAAQTLQLLLFFPAIPVALGTWSSIATFIRLALLTGIASLAMRLKEDDLIALPGVLILSVSSLASVAVASHVAAAGGLWWAVPDFVHLSAAALWTGGLILLARLASIPMGDSASGLARIPLREAMRRFTPWAAASVVLLVLTGSLGALVQVPAWAALWRTLYGGTLTTKVLLLLPLLGLALLNTLWCRGKLVNGGSGARGQGPVGARVWAWGKRRFGRSDWAVRGEVALAGVALLCAAALTQLPPPKDAAYGPSPPITLEARADGLTLAITITSPGGLLAPSRAALSVLDAQGQPPPDARVILRPETMEEEVRIQPVTATARGDGWYDAEIFFSMRGRWDLLAIVRRKGQEDALARFALMLSDSGFSRIDPDAPRTTRLSLSAAWAGQATRRQVLIGAGLALGSCVLAGIGAWRRRWAEVGMAFGLLVVAWLYLWPALAVDTTPATLRRNPMAADSKSLEAGRALFSENCAICHGARGRPSPLDLAPTLAMYAVNLDLTADHMAQHTDGDLFWWLARGIPGTPMPAYGEGLNDEERWHLVNYIRSLRQRAQLRTQD